MPAPQQQQQQPVQVREIHSFRDIWMFFVGLATTFLFAFKERSPEEMWELLDKSNTWFVAVLMLAVASVLFLCIVGKLVTALFASKEELEEDDLESYFPIMAWIVAAILLLLLSAFVLASVEWLKIAAFGSALALPTLTATAFSFLMHRVLPHVDLDDAELSFDWMRWRATVISGVAILFNTIGAIAYALSLTEERTKAFGLTVVGGVLGAFVFALLTTEAPAPQAE